MKTALKILGYGTLGLLLLVLLLAGAAYFFPSWFQRPQPVTETPAPSGRIYKILTKGPIFFTKGGKALALSYRTDSPDDKSRLAQEANELMSLLNREAVAGGFESLVIMAHGPARQAKFGFMVDSSLNTVFQRTQDGDWEDIAVSSGAVAISTSAAEAATRKSLEDAYSRVVAAAKLKDFGPQRELMTANYWHRLSDGNIVTAAQEVEMAAKGFASIESFESLDANFTRVINKEPMVIVLVTQITVGTIKDASGKSRKFRDEKLCRDTWINTGGVWKIDLSEDVTAKFAYLD